ncbi:hypothetical protein MN116_006101 [Schistosoma mekongi]|uniref:GDNF/GAS1 domain-containing protein n=1 Tax=Schistosoma mekongi TaxID=38744 RepID=A0AAE2D3X9_SCHME|nr:hypothetical protein MN116_006101 [Schistosoma mekongi]
MYNLFNSYIYVITLIHLPYYLTQTDWDIRANVIIPSPTSSSSTSTAPLVPQKPASHDVGNEIKTLVKENSKTHFLNPPHDVTEKQEISIDCLEGLNNCESFSGICKVDVDIFKTFCGDWTDERSLMGCHRKYLRECQSALKTMNLGRPGLKYCTCDSRSSRSIDDLTKCNLLRKNLNNHPCLSEPPIFLRELHPSGNLRQESRNEFKTENSSTQLENSVDTNTKRLDTSLMIKSYESSTPMTTALPVTINISASVESSNTGWVDEHLNIRKENTSCLDLLEKCTKLPACAIALNKFRALCTIRTCNRLKIHCLEASKKFLQFKTHMNCNCQSELDEGRYRRCLDYKDAVIDNKCVEISTNQQVNLVNGNDPDFSSAGLNIDRNSATAPIPPAIHITYPVATENNLAGLENRTSFKLQQLRLITTNNSEQKQKEIANLKTNVAETWNNNIDCYSVFHECLHEPICLQYFVNLRNGCARMNKQFDACRNPTQCISTLEGFYKETKSLINRAISCTCIESDLDCKQIQNVFVPSCIRHSYGLRVDCYQAWIQCQNDPVCRTSYDLLVSECQTSDGLCYLNPTTCLNSYRRLWSGPWAGGCNCEVTPSMRNSSDNVLTGCSEFGRILTQPPCLENSLKTLEAENQALTNKPPYCRIIETLQMSSEDFIRIPSLHDYQEQRQLGRNCSLLCNCQFGCRYEMCYETGIKIWHPYYLSNRTSQNVTVSTRIQSLNIYQPNLSLACLYLPKFNSHCTCYAYNEVVCNIIEQKNQYIISGHKLLIDFNLEMYSTTIDLLADDRSLSEYELYGSIVQLEFLLTNFLAQLIGQKSCRLILSAYHSSDDEHLWLKQHSTDNISNKLLKRLEYMLVINSDISHYVENNTSLCVNLLEILNIMINDQYPQIRYHAKFSTFQKSTLKTPALNEHYDLHKNRDAKFHMQQLQRNHQQQKAQESQTWRHSALSTTPVQNNRNISSFY